MGAAQTSSAFFPVAGDLINGKYEIERMLGRGGMGAVFAAQNRMTGRRVALKWVLPEKATPGSRERLLREARATCAVSHPNVVQVFDVCEHQGGLFIVMEYLEGESLADLLELRGALEPAELIGLLMPALRGVQACHEAGVVHRDVKPDNILLCPEPSGELLPKVLDFGVSKTFGHGQRLDTSLTHTGALVGTPHFMALEQVDGSGDIDVRTDVYAFGVILYLGLTGEPPFDGENLGELILKIGTRTPASIRAYRPHLPSALDRVVRRATARARDQRYSSLQELGEALEPFAHGVRFRRDSADTTGAVSQRLAGRALAAHSTSPGRRRRLRALLAALLCAMAIATGALWAWGTEPARSQAAGGNREVEAQRAAPPSDEPRAPLAPRTGSAAKPRSGAPHPADSPDPLPAPRRTRPADLVLELPADFAVPAAAEPRPTEEGPVGDDVAPNKLDGPVGTPRAAARTERGRRRSDLRHRPPPPRPETNEERIRGQRTPGLSADEF